MEAFRERAAVSWCRMGPFLGRSRNLSIGSANRLRGRPAATLHTHFQWTLRHKPQPDVRWLDITLSRRCACHAERVDGRINSSCGRTHPSRGPARRTCAGGCFRGKLLPVPEAGPPISLTAGAERQNPSMMPEETTMTSDTLIEEINTAYRRLSAATEDLARADGELAEHIGRFALTTPRPSSRPGTRGRPNSTSKACSTPKNIVAWRPVRRGRNWSSSTPGSRSIGCNSSSVC